MKILKCKPKNYQCGGKCQRSSNACQSKISVESASTLDELFELIGQQTGLKGLTKDNQKIIEEKVIRLIGEQVKKPVPKNKELIGKGFYGKVYDLGNGTVEKDFFNEIEASNALRENKAKIKGEEFIPSNEIDEGIYVTQNGSEGFGPDREARNTKLASDAGFGPKFISYDEDNKKMITEKVEGQTLKEALNGADTSKRAELLNKSIDLMGTIHNKGFTHNDLHDENQILRNGEFVAIDMGSLKDKASWKDRIKELDDKMTYRLNSGGGMYPPRHKKIFDALDLDNMSEKEIETSYNEISQIMRQDANEGERWTP